MPANVDSSLLAHWTSERERNAEERRFRHAIAREHRRSGEACGDLFQDQLAALRERIEWQRARLQAPPPYGDLA